MIAAKGLHDVAQTGLNGLSLGAIYALGAVGLTLVYGILKLVNFAHGDFLTFGAYMAYLVNVTWGMPLVVGGLLGDGRDRLLGVVLEKVMWGPMRRQRRRAAAAAPDVDRARVRAPLRDPVRLGHRDPHRSTSNDTDDGRVPRPADRPHGADRDHRRLRRPDRRPA